MRFSSIILIGRRLLASANSTSSSSSSSSPKLTSQTTAATTQEKAATHKNHSEIKPQATVSIKKTSISNASLTNEQPSHYNQSEILIIKDSCLNRLKQILERPHEEYLRINVETGGCSGFSYQFDINDKQKVNSEEDIVIERENYKIVVNKEVLPLIQGSSIEFNESLIKSSFQVVNPIAETKCSCGASFSVDFNKLSKQN